MFQERASDVTTEIVGSMIQIRTRVCCGVRAMMLNGALGLEVPLRERNLPSATRKGDVMETILGILGSLALAIGCLSVCVLFVQGWATVVKKGQSGWPLC